eukprot:5706391-Pyramimonas_sp.AAC.1
MIRKIAPPDPRAQTSDPIAPSDPTTHRSIKQRAPRAPTPGPIPPGPGRDPRPWQALSPPPPTNVVAVVGRQSSVLVFSH